MSNLKQRGDLPISGRSKTPNDLFNHSNKFGEFSKNIQLTTLGNDNLTDIQNTTATYLKELKSQSISKIMSPSNNQTDTAKFFSELSQQNSQQLKTSKGHHTQSTSNNYRSTGIVISNELKISSNQSQVIQQRVVSQQPSSQSGLNSTKSGGKFNNAKNSVILGGQGNTASSNVGRLEKVNIKPNSE